MGLPRSQGDEVAAAGYVAAVGKAVAWDGVPEGRRRTMAAIRGKDTRPELHVRRLLHRLGYRFRLHRRDLPGTPDIVFPSRRKVIEVRGCFWHAHGCALSRAPRSRQEYWGPKLAATRARDARNSEALRALGWDMLVLWECRLPHAGTLEDELVLFLGPSGATSTRTRPRTARTSL